MDAVLYVQLQQPLVRSLLTISYVTLDSRITRVYPWKLSTKRFTEQLMGQVHRLSYLNGLENLHPSELQTSTNISPWPTWFKDSHDFWAIVPHHHVDMITFFNQICKTTHCWANTTVSSPLEPSYWIQLRDGSQKSDLIMSNSAPTQKQKHIFAAKQHLIELKLSHGNQGTFNLNITNYQIIFPIKILVFHHYLYSSARDFGLLSRCKKKKFKRNAEKKASKCKNFLK